MNSVINLLVWHRTASVAKRVAPDDGCHGVGARGTGTLGDDVAGDAGVERDNECRRVDMEPAKNPIEPTRPTAIHRSTVAEGPTQPRSRLRLRQVRQFRWAQTFGFNSLSETVS